MRDETTDFGGDLIDVTGLSLRDLDEIGESSLAHALHRLLDEDDIAPIAGFQSRI